MEITTTLNGVKFLIVEELATRRTQQKLIAKAKRHGAIYQGIKEFNSAGFFSEPYGIIRVLVPEDKIYEYDNDED